MALVKTKILLILGFREIMVIGLPIQPLLERRQIRAHFVLQLFQKTRSPITLRRMASIDVLSFHNASDFATLGVRRHDTLIGVFSSVLPGSELASLCNQPSLGRRHQLAFRRRVIDVRLVDLLRELHRG